MDWFYLKDLYPLNPLADYKVVLKDGFVMTSKIVLYAENFYFRNHLTTNITSNTDWMTFREIFDTGFVAKKDQRALLNCFCAWVQVDFNNRSQFFMELLQMINFKFLPMAYITDVLAHNSEIHSIDGVSIYLYQKTMHRMNVKSPSFKGSDILVLGGNDEDVYAGTCISNFNVSVETVTDFGNLHFDRNYFGCEMVDDKIFVFGSADVKYMEAFDVVKRKSEIHRGAFKDERRGFSTVLLDKRIWMFGGIIGDEDEVGATDEIKIFDVERMCIVDTRHMLVPNKGHETVLIGNSIYCVGGEDTRISRYDPREGVWELYPRSLFEGSESAVCSYSGNILKCGGLSSLSAFESIRNCEMYDIRGGFWQEIPELPMASSASKCCELDDCVIYFNNSHGIDLQNHLLKYKKATNEWVDVGLYSERFISGFNIQVV
uniref:BACK domain-containing protein n=1 Tax=Rhabditophanes sp. KR3021 TaxID=114890 RepID=A0AC35TG49_9BILA